MVPFTINRNSKLPIHEQLKHQIRYAIVSGNLNPGEPLPSIRELTTTLKVNRNTVHRVYLELQAEGLLTSKSGKGIYVSPSLKSPSTHLRLDELDELVHSTFEEALKLGVNPVSLSHLLTHKAADFDRAHPNIAFVECTTHASMEIASDIASDWSTSVLNFELEEIQKNPDSLPSSVHYVITSFFHEEEVRQALRKKAIPTFVVTYDLHKDSREGIEKLDSKKQIGFITKDANTPEILVQKIQECHSKPLHIESGCMETPKGAVELIEKSDILAFTAPALTFVADLAKDHQTLVQIDFELNSHSLALIKDHIFPF